MKKLFLFSCLFALCSLNILAAEEDTPTTCTVGGLRYILNSFDVYSYDKAYPNGQNEIEIPATVEYKGETYTVAWISDNAFNSSPFKKITIPETVWKIETNAFVVCANLESINIPDKVTNIPVQMCMNCISLKEVTLGTGIEYFEHSAFMGCKAIEKVYVKSKKIKGKESSVFPDEVLRNATLYIPIDARYYTLGFTNVVRYNYETNEVIPNPVTSITLSSTELALELDAKAEETTTVTATLTATVAPDTATYSSVTWASDNEDVATVVDGVVTALKAGTANITATAMDGTGIVATCVVTVTEKGNDEVVDGVVDAASTGLVFTYDSTAYTASVAKGTYSGDIVIPAKVLYNDTVYTVTSIGKSAFANCTSLTSVVIPEGITSIGNTAFTNCSRLTSVVIPEGVTSMGYFAFQNCYRLTSVVIPKSMTVIATGAFQYCSSLTSVVIPEGVTSIYNVAFSGCTSLTSVVLPKGVTSISLEAFMGCTSLTSVVISEGITSIDNNVFEGCTSLTSVVISEGITSIGNNVFEGCTSLTSVVINAVNVPTFGDESIGVEFVFVPKTSIAEYRTALSGCGYEEHQILAIEDKNEFEVTVTAEESKSGLMAALGAYGITEADNSAWNVLKLKVSGTINSYDFMIMRNKMLNLRYLDLSDATIVYNAYQHYQGYHSNDNELPAYAFYESDLIECKLPKNITSIGHDAFNMCGKLQSMDIPEGVTAIPDNAFNDCVALTTVNLPKSLKTIGISAFNNTGLVEIKFPMGLTTIKGMAFANTKLTEVHLPSSLTKVYNYAFSASTFSSSPLLDIYTYVVEPVNIGQNTFHSDTYTNATIHVPATSFTNYYYDTQWSQFQKKEKFDEPYEYFYLSKDFTMEEETPRLDGVVADSLTLEITPPDADFNAGSGFIVKGDDRQDLDEVHVKDDGNGNAGSIIGSGTEGNIYVNNLHIDINVTSGRWYFFSFPFDIKKENIKYDGSSVWREYDSQLRAEKKEGVNYAGAWKDVEENEGVYLHRGKGYIFQGSKAGVLTLIVPEASFNGEDKDLALNEYVSTGGDSKDASWNFVGNPHLNYFDVYDLGYEHPITVWNGSKYETFNPKHNEENYYVMHPYQAFFVQKPSGTDSIEFKAEKRQTQTQVEESVAASARTRIARSMNKTWKLVNVTLTNGTSTDVTKVVFDQNRLTTYEIGYDASKFLTNGVPQLYSLDADNTAYSINERPKGNGVVALGYQAPVAGKYTIAVTRADMGVMLTDKLTGKSHYFTNGEYTFTSAAGTFNDRFLLVTTGEGTVGINGVYSVGNAAVGVVDGQIAVSGAEGQEATVTTVGGVTVGSISGNGSLAVAPGTYIVTVGGSSHKIMVK